MKNFNLFICFIFGFQLLTQAQQIEVITQEQSKGIINHLTYSPDGSLLASGSENDPIIKIWDTKSGKIIGKLDCHEKSTTAIQFSPNGKTIVSASKDNLIILWDIINWEIIDSISVKHPINSIKFKSDESFYTGSENGTVEHWQTKTFKTPTQIYDCGSAINKIDVLNSKLVVGTKSGIIASFDIDNNAEILKKRIHLGKIVGLKIYNSGENIISAGGDGLIHFWNLNKLIESKHIKASTVAISAFDANESKDKIIIANKNKSIKVYTFKGELIHDFTAKTNDTKQPINAITLSPNGTSIASANHRIIPSIRKTKKESVIQIWDLKRGVIFKTFKGEVNPIYSFDYHPTQNRLITLGDDQKVTFWDFETAEKYGDFSLEKPKREIPPRRKKLNIKKKGGKFLKIASDLANGNLPTINSPDLKKAGKNVGSAIIKRQFKEQSLIKYSSKGSYLITKLKKDEIRLYSLKDRKPEYVKPLFSYQPSINSILCSPDETNLMVLGSGDSAVSIINLETGAFDRKLSTPAPIGDLSYIYEATSMAFSPDEKYFAVCFNTSKIFVYETNSWQMVFQNSLPNNLGYVKGAFVNFSEDGEYIVVNTMIGVVKYNIKTFNIFDGGLAKTRGTSIPLDKASDFTVTVHEGYLYFENTLTGEITKGMKVNPDNITHVSVKSNGKIGVTLLSGQFILMNPKTGVNEVLLVSNGDNYIFKTDENFYKVSKEGLDLVTYRIGNKAFPFEQFDAIFNRPDLVLKKLNSKDNSLISLYKKAHEKRLKKLGLSPTTHISLQSIPTCAINNINDIPSFTESNTIDLSYKFGDSQSLQSYNIWVNNVPIYGKKGKSISGKKTYSNSEKIELVYGVNKIQIASRNKDGYESLIETFFIDKTGIKPAKNLYLITIGTSSYKDNNFNLSYPVKDGKDLLALMSDNSKKSYDAVITKSLFDEEVTIENVASLKTFLSQTTVNDVVILFVAGHGVLDANFDYYFGTYDMDFNSPKERGLAYDDLESVLDGIKAKRKILIMDTCHSGEIDEEEVFFSEEDEEQEEDISFRSAGSAIKTDETKPSASKMMNLLFNDLRKGTGATVISSAGGTEYAMESDEWKNGLFTYCMLMGLKNGKADLDNDGAINLIELQTYVTEKVKGLSHGKQIPNTRIQNLELDFKIW